MHWRRRHADSLCGVHCPEPNVCTVHASSQFLHRTLAPGWCDFTTHNRAVVSRNVLEPLLPTVISPALISSNAPFLRLTSLSCVYLRASQCDRVYKHRIKPRACEPQSYVSVVLAGLSPHLASATPTFTAPYFHGVGRTFQTPLEALSVAFAVPSPAMYTHF
ncbi:hypothetical protein BU23DRAFT_56008 [Bimuria novae-zelandiae CBS 107.79]|uniref:Uncharacterized protein n=1 Tax=Bimuria novae-zelandiae CBS 107.79 TaxID=1447943 RepID=A0A6A5VJC0_9PLEO|nr:hypothetical protein BU23DRAFT_56008 [Bimuria novae-zelandiae CBS 107.79]